MLRTIVHVVAALQFSYGMYYDIYYVNIPKEVMQLTADYAGKLKFLTFWDEIVQTIFFWICVTNDFVGSNENDPRPKPLIRKIKDFLHISIGFPVGMFVATTFWALYAIDRELVLPQAIDPYFPTWLNHIVHTNVAIFTILEMITSFRLYPSRKQGITTLLLFMLAYLVWTFWIYFQTSQWVYPVLNVLNWPLRGAFFVGLLGFVIILYFVGEYFNSLVWGDEIKRAQRSSSGSRRKRQ